MVKNQITEIPEFPKIKTRIKQSNPRIITWEYSIQIQRKYIEKISNPKHKPEWTNYMQNKQPSQSRGPSLVKRTAFRNSQAWTSVMIQKIIQLEDIQGQQYFSKNSLEQIILKIDKTHIQVIDKFSKYRESGFNLLEFVRFFLNILEHEEIENIYLTIGLIDFFKAVSTFAGQEKVSFGHITNFLCQKILEKQQSKNQIEAKNIPEITFVNPNYQLKDFIRNPPVIYGSGDQTLFKLSQNSILTDKAKHMRAVNSSAFSHDLKMIFTLDALSESISVYDFNCTQINKIYPSFSKIKKDVIVLSFAFSQRQCRIGAVFKNFSIVFWDCSAGNTFDYEKAWSTTSCCQHLQSSIYYLEYFNCWITSDKTGTIYFWDLLNGRPFREFKCKYFSSVNILCEIAPLNIVAVVQESKQLHPEQVPYFASSQHTHIQKKTNLYECNITLYNYFTGEILNEITSSDDRVPHTIQYSQQFQILFAAGLQKKIKLWQINPTYMDSSLKGELIGHQNLITSFTQIKKTSLLISCDDKGKIKLWDFKNFACIQTIDFSDKAMITNLLDMIEIGKIGVLGSRIHYIDFEDKQQVIKKIKNKEKLSIEWVDFDQCRNQIYIFTQKDLRVYDMGKGCVKYIYGCFNSSDEDYTCFRYFSCILKFAIGNDKGEVSLYDITTGSYLYKLNTPHQGSVVGVEYDQLNKLFVTIGLDSSILVHKQTTRQLVRQIKGNFYGKEISCFQLSVFHNMIAISTHEKQFSRSVLLWNYQYGKLAGEIVINEHYEVVSLQFINGYNILAIATNEGTINMVRIKQMNGAEIKLQELDSLELKKLTTSMSCDMILKGGKRSQLEECMFIVSFEDGTFQQINMTDYIRKFQEVPHVKEKNNYNPYRESKQTFQTQYMKNKHCKLELVNKSLLHKRTILKQKTQKSNFFFSTKQIAKESSFNKVQTKINIDLGASQYEPDQVLDQAEQKSPSKSKVKFTPVSMKKFDEPQQTPNQTTPSMAVNSLPMQSGFSQLNILKIMNYEKRFILMVGNNKRMKIFTHDYKLICDLNINYPLPYLWKFKPRAHKKVTDKIYFAIKVLNVILHKYESDISIGEAKNFKLKELFDCINGRKSFYMTTNPKLIENNMYQRQSLMITEPSASVGAKAKEKAQTQSQEKILLIQEEYTKNDINYELVKAYNFHDVGGPTLKELDHIKKIEMLQKEWRDKQKQQQEDRDRLLKMIQTRVRKNQQKDELATFLSPPPTIITKSSKQNAYILNLKKKIDNIKTSVTKQEESKLIERSMAFMNGSKLVGFSLIKQQTKKQDMGLTLMKQQTKIQNFGLVTTKQQAKKQDLGLMTLTRQQSKKQQQPSLQDKQLLQNCMRKYKSVNCLKQKVPPAKFQQYYERLRQTSKSKLFKKPAPLAFDLTNTFDSKKRYAFNKCDTQPPEMSVRKEKTFNSTFGEAMRSQEAEKPATTGGKFRRILTEMKEQVREMRLEKMRIV